MHQPWAKANKDMNICLNDRWTLSPHRVCLNNNYGEITGSLVTQPSISASPRERSGLSVKTTHRTDLQGLTKGVTPGAGMETLGFPPVTSELELTPPVRTFSPNAQSHKAHSACELEKQGSFMCES